MKRLRQRAVRAAFLSAIPIFLLIVQMAPVEARQYAAMVMDARTGKVLHSRNADTRLHPASLTKMMTLYIAFEAVERGEISLDTKVKISKNAAAEPASKLYLKAGQRIEFRYLIRAAAVKSANDAATAIGEAISGSESAFAARMTRTAKALGMNNTTFKNAHGLTRSGHLSTARDMTILGRHVFYDYPEYYNLFSRRTTNAGITQVANTNRRLLNSYRGADGIKTGYTNAAGSNLVASAERGNVRIIATMFGGSSSAARNKRVAELLDMGFSRAPKYASVQKPRKPNYAMASATRLMVKKSPIPAARPARIVALAAARAEQEAATLLAANTDSAPTDTAEVAALAESAAQEAAAVVAMLADTGLRPVPRPASESTVAEEQTAPASEEIIVAAAEVPATEETPEISGTEVQVAEVTATDATTEPSPSDIIPDGIELAATLTSETPDAVTEDTIELAAADTSAPDLGNAKGLALAAADTTQTPEADLVTMRRGVEDTLAAIAASQADKDTARSVAVALTEAPEIARPTRRPARVTYSTSDMTTVAMTTPVMRPVVVSTRDSGRGQWGVRVGRYNTRYEAERVLLQTALQQVDLLGDARRTVIAGSRGFEVQFVGLSEDAAALTCQRLSAIDERCAPFGS